MDLGSTDVPPLNPRVWCLTTGEAGLRQQARGLARELSPEFEERVVRVGRLMGLAPPSLFRLTLAGVHPLEGKLSPPWPDVLVSCGRRAGLAAMAIRRKSKAPIVTIHIQAPSVPAAFDLVVAMPHDRLEGENVICVDTALHGVRATTLQAAAALSDLRFAELPRPWTGVLLGGATARTPFTVEDAQRLAAGLDVLRARTGGSLLITPSRRTPPGVIAALSAHFAQDASIFFWDGSGANPYLSILAMADAIAVTSDSISMISEAMATTADLYVFEVAGGGRHQNFLQSIFKQGLIARLGDTAPRKRATGIDATPSVAAIAREMMRQKLSATT